MDEALLSRGGSTEDGWVALGAKRSQLAGRLARIRATAGIDEDGNTIFIRRHHPDDPRRSPDADASPSTADERLAVSRSQAAGRGRARRPAPEDGPAKAAGRPAENGTYPHRVS